MSKAVLIGQDAAPSRAFGLIKTELENVGWSVETFLGNGKRIENSSEEIFAAVNSADIVLSGMSAPALNAREEIAVVDYARHKGISYGFYADTFGAWERPWFKTLQNKASILLVLNEEEMRHAASSYPKARIVISGNHEWEESGFPKYSRREIREKLGINDFETMVFVPGHKSVAITSFLLMGVVHALHQSEVKNLANWHVIFSPHPGDGVSTTIYADPVLYTSDLVRVSIITKEKTYIRAESPELREIAGGFSSSDLLPGADLVVESASTFCQAAAIRRIPVISFLSEVSKIRNVLVFGQREWMPVLQGVALESYGDANNLAVLMYTLLDSGSDARKKMSERQIALYPGFQNKGEFAHRITQALQEIG